jgi:hypothetical protein
VRASVKISVLAAAVALTAAMTSCSASSGSSSASAASAASAASGSTPMELPSSVKPAAVATCPECGSPRMARRELREPEKEPGAYATDST